MLLDRERAVLLTPAHQFPTGGPLHPERRAAVIDWARARGGLVLEDDYDGEFRYDRRPVGAVQGLDPERVIHLGSVSKSLSPALRLGWMVLPERYVEPVLALKGEREGWTSALDQLALADFLGSGSYDRHVRRMRQRYRRRRDRLVAALAAHAPHVEVTGVAAGLHAVLRLPPGTERSAVKAAAWRGIALDGLAEFRHPEFHEPGTTPRRRPGFDHARRARRGLRGTLRACLRCGAGGALPGASPGMRSIGNTNGHQAVALGETVHARPQSGFQPGGMRPAVGSLSTGDGSHRLAADPSFCRQAQGQPYASSLLAVGPGGCPMTTLR